MEERHFTFHRNGLREPMARWSFLWIGVLAVALIGCGSGARGPAVHQIHPAAVLPGGFLMLTGERMDRVVALTIGGQRAGQTTMVNSETVTAVAPIGLAAGDQLLALTTSDGRVVRRTITVATPQPPPRSDPSPVAATPPPSPTPPSPPASLPVWAVPFPQRPSPPALSESEEREDEKDKDNKDDKDEKEREGEEHRLPGSVGHGRGR
jgi:hypothetical protein